MPTGQVILESDPNNCGFKKKNGLRMCCDLSRPATLLKNNSYISCSKLLMVDGDLRLYLSTGLVQTSTNQGYLISAEEVHSGCVPETTP